MKSHNNVSKFSVCCTKEIHEHVYAKYMLLITITNHTLITYICKTRSLMINYTPHV
jgi:hypothetical protein